MIESGGGKITEIVDILTNDPRVVAAVVAVITFILVYVLKPFRLLVWGIITHFLKNRKNRLHVRKINNSNSGDFDSFIAAYHEIFEEDDRTATSEIINWLNGKGLSVRIRYNCFICISDGKTIAIAINMFSEKYCLSYIPFLGMTKTGEKWQLGRPAVKNILGSVERCQTQPTYFILEMGDPSEKNISEAVRKRRLARIRRFQGLSSSCGLSMVSVPIGYQQPSYHTDTIDKADKSMLLVLLIKDGTPNNICKNEVMNILRFLYYDVYATCFNGSDEERSRYKSFANEVISRYDGKIKDNVELYPM